MLMKGVPIDSDTIVHTLKACASIGDVKTAFEVLQLMKEKKITPNKYIYNQILKVYSGACKIEFIPDETIELYIKVGVIMQEYGLRTRG